MTHHNNSSPRNIPILHTSHIVFLAIIPISMSQEVRPIQILQLNRIVEKISLMTNGHNHNSSNLSKNSNFLISYNITNMLKTKVLNLCFLSNKTLHLLCIVLICPTLKCFV
jgi:hypothetical protein